MPTQRTKIVVIGGGTGLTTAWALEKQDEFEVTLVEASHRLGGHIHTITTPDGYILEGGAEFIGLPASYPKVNTLMKHFGVQFQTFDLNTVLINTQSKEHIMLPPYSGKTDCCCSCFGFFSNRHNTPQDALHVDWFNALKNITNLLDLHELIQQAKEKLLHPDEVLTVEAFAEWFIKNDDHLINMEKRTFVNTILYPLLSAAWGVELHDMKEFCAHYALNYLALGQQWQDAKNGLSTCYSNMAKACTKTNFVMGSPVAKLETVQVGAADAPVNQYKVRLTNGNYILDHENNIALFDHVVLTTPANVTKDIISDLDDPQMRLLKEKLSAVNYYHTQLVFHRDTRYLFSPTPENDRVLHIHYNGKQAANTATKYWKYKKGEVPIMKTWILPGQEEPDPKTVVHRVEYFHPHMKRPYYEAQHVLHNLQGQHGIYFGGILAGFNDSHESATTVALDIAHRICAIASIASNERLALFKAHENSSQLRVTSMTDVSFTI